MFTLSTHIELPIAHRLPGAYSGLCVGNVSRDGTKTFPKDDLGMVHGHNYNITFAVSTDKMNEDFMVMDFKKVKKIIHEEMDQYDHSLILKEGDALINFYKEEYAKRNVELADTRLFVWEQAPTAEYMAYYWYQIFMKKFKEAGIEVCKLTITVEETSHNSVTYTEEGEEGYQLIDEKGNPLLKITPTSLPNNQIVLETKDSVFSGPVEFLKVE